MNVNCYKVAGGGLLTGGSGSLQLHKQTTDTVRGLWFDSRAEHLAAAGLQLHGRNRKTWSDEQDVSETSRSIVSSSSVSQLICLAASHFF